MIVIGISENYPIYYDYNYSMCITISTQYTIIISIRCAITIFI